MNEEVAEDIMRLFPDVGSDNAIQMVPVRLVNRSSSSVDVFWLNYQKQPIKYGTLNVRQYLDINTFETHPWVARRTRDGCKALMDEQPVYWPVPNNQVGRRRRILITMKVQSLKDVVSYSMLNLNQEVVNQQIVQLPRDLQLDIVLLQATKEEYDSTVSRANLP